ncbi:MAG TPA: hypothetical protein PK619_03145 [bacterium]|nr:hypothetical protein [bacterium]HPW39684.1 hypothetical protein [bacterium]
MLGIFIKKRLGDRNYQKSNCLTTVDFDASVRAQKLAREILASSTTNERQKLGEALLDELSDLAKLEIITLKISDTRQYHRKLNGRVAAKRYGYYRPRSNYIYIQNLTAVRGQILAAKTFLDTLLHEWLHHYDTYKLGLNSIHSRGFYERLNDLKKKLAPK